MELCVCVCVYVCACVRVRVCVIFSKSDQLTDDIQGVSSSSHHFPVHSHIASFVPHSVPYCHIADGQHAGVLTAHSTCSERLRR